MERTIVEAINLALFREMKRDKNVVVLGEDVGRNGGVFRVTDGLQKKFGENRVMDTPLSEAGIVAASIGMAVAGLRPVAEIQFSGFLYAGIDHLISHASRIRHRSRGAFSCPLVIRTPYGGGIRALEHHSESMEALYCHIPGLKVVVPSTPYEAKGLLAAAIRDNDPVIFFEPQRLYRQIKEEVPDKEYVIPLGKCKLAREGKDVTIISWGAMLQVVKDAASRVDIDCEIVNVMTLKPLDMQTIINSVKKTGRCIIVHEAPKTSGFGAEIIARLNEEIFGELKAPVERVAGFDTVFPLYKMERLYLPNVVRVVEAMKRVMSY
ncbi:MAG TPA: alpha-ketoacid dehydrogenase subunit beta [Candidatus Nanoarchaeia archaeon]|nr:alpha-ketoacid dehydrogenase subunit beta [Candidatus Nanoarchaeia archaeon]